MRAKLVVGACMAAVLSVGASAQAPHSPAGLPAGPPVNIQMVTQSGPTFPQYTRVDIPMLREGLPRSSNGRIRVTLASWPERGLNGPEIIRLVRSGQVDVGAVPLTTVAGDVPLLDVVDLAGMNPSLAQARRVATAMVPEANRELERFGVRIVATYPIAAQVFFCRGRVTSLSELRGKRVRTPGGSMNDFVGSLSAQPTGIGFPEVYAALERGVVHCAVTGSSSGNGGRWYEVTQSLYALPTYWAVSMYIVNLNWWNRLDPPVRELLERTMREVEDAQWALGEETSEDGIACNAGDRENCRIGRLVEGRPMSVHRPSPEDIEAMRRTFSSVVLPAWLRRCGDRCGEVYTRVVQPITGVALGR